MRHGVPTAALSSLPETRMGAWRGQGFDFNKLLGFVKDETVRDTRPQAFSPTPMTNNCKLREKLKGTRYPHHPDDASNSLLRLLHHTSGLAPSIHRHPPSTVHRPPSIRPSVHRSIGPSAHRSICPSVHPSIRLTGFSIRHSQTLCSDLRFPTTKQHGYWQQGSVNA